MVGNWWFEPSEASCCCSSAVNNAFLRTMTTSFGSVCFGSLLVAILQALRALANAAQANDDGGCCVCILECILGCLASLMEYFNKWAFICTCVTSYFFSPALSDDLFLWRSKHEQNLTFLFYCFFRRRTLWLSLYSYVIICCC
jgi:Plasma-membrane choline transporter